MSELRIATRKSALALWQANYISDSLRRSGVEQVSLAEVSTVGDRDQSQPLSALGGMGTGQGVFTREVQRAVLDGRADLAVHSLKDLPTEATPGLILAAVPVRAPRADLLVFPKDAPKFDEIMRKALLPDGARIGTGSIRRQAQLRYFHSGWVCKEIRGNVDTRLRKLDEGEFEAIVLAEAGLERLNLLDRPTVSLTRPIMWPAVGQAALGIECRADDEETISALKPLIHGPTFAEVLAERALLSTLRAGCHAPVGALSRVVGSQLILEGVVLSPEGDERIIREVSGSVTSPELVGEQVAQLLIEAGAERFLTASES